MLNQYPDQTRARRGFALIGVIFFVFGLFMTFIDSVAGAMIGFALGSLLFFPPLLMGHARFTQYEKWLGWLNVLNIFS